jgi:cell division topological specificity factor MinE
MTVIISLGSNRSKDEAKKRLTLVLAYERKGLPPNFIERLKDELVCIFSKYPQFDVSRIEIEIRKENDDFEEVWIGVPFKQ